MIARALLSVSDKTGLIPFARFLHSRGVELISTGGTAQALRDASIPVRDVSDVTHFPEMMDGRVKTLHPLVHGGLLARRADAAHMQSATEHHIAMIDLLVVNLYPFETTLNKTTDYDTLVENIDIGGPAMIRAAAKNHESVTVIVDVADYAEIETILRENNNEINAPARRRFAAKAFARCASYDTLISSWLSSVPSKEESGDGRRVAGDSLFPAYLLDASLGQTLRYGENPHQRAAVYQRLDGNGGIAHAQQLQGKELSYNNLADADAAWQIASSFAAPTATLIKHANPCGVASDANMTTAFTKALASDPVSAFGGILAVNREVNAALVAAIGSLFLEVIVAPAFSDDARATLTAKKNLRLLIATPENHKSPLSGWMIHAISGGYLVQENDEAVSDSQSWQRVSGQDLEISRVGEAEPRSGGGQRSEGGKTPFHQQLADAALAWNVVKYVKSNAIVLVKNGATIGVGAGQMSRVDSVRIAIEKARAHGHDPKGSVLASDAFFPFADNMELAAAAGISLVIQPGGSMRDAEVIDAAKKHGIAMIFTGTRHFKH